MTSTESASNGKVKMPTKSKSSITTSSLKEAALAYPEAASRRLPPRRAPTSPGEMLLEEFIKPLGITQSELAVRLGVSFPRLNDIVHARRSVTPDTALRLARVLGMPADFWLGLQVDWDLW